MKNFNNQKQESYLNDSKKIHQLYTSQSNLKILLKKLYNILMLKIKLEK